MNDFLDMVADEASSGEATQGDVLSGPEDTGYVPVDEASSGEALTVDDVSRVVVENNAALLKETQQQLDEMAQTLMVTQDAAVTRAVEESGTTSETAMVVVLDAEQWGRIDHAIEMAQSAVTLQNALLLLTLCFCCGLVGLRVFSEFSRGFRRG